MTSAAKKILQEVLALPEDDRRRLGEAILESVPSHSEEEIRQAWTEEAVRRAEALERGEGEVLDLDEALESIRADLRQIHKP